MNERVAYSQPLKRLAAESGLGLFTIHIIEPDGTDVLLQGSLSESDVQRLKALVQLFVAEGAKGKEVSG